MSDQVTPRWWFFMSGMNAGCAINFAVDGRAWSALFAAATAVLCLWLGRGDL